MLSAAPRIIPPQAVARFATAAAGSHKSIYDFTAKDIDGNQVSLDKYK